MESTIKHIHSALIAQNKTVSLAESCTGGMLSSLLTAQSGASAYFVLGVIVYSNQMKNKLLGIPLSVIERRGAVSKEVATAMAAAVRKVAKTDFGIGITGIAGPLGGSKDKPVGTVYIAEASNRVKICRRFNFKGSRTSIRKQSCLAALMMLKKLLDN